MNRSSERRSKTRNYGRGSAAITLVCALLTSSCSNRPQGKPDANALFQVRFVGDPIEGFNRGVFAVNDVLLRYVASPLGRGYRFIVPEAARSALVRFRDNTRFPSRLVNNLLQAKFRGAATETGRFVVNTTVGILGLFDPARHIGLEASREDCGQTFARWGSGPGFYLYLPLLGPDTGRDAVGDVGDAFLDPAWLVNPWLGLAFAFNHFTFRIDDLDTMNAGEVDPYLMQREFWMIDRAAWIRDTELQPSSPGAKPLPELDVVITNAVDPDFYGRAERFEVEVPGALTQDSALGVSAWLQDERSPLALIVPGIGSFRDAPVTLAAAERLFAEGFSVAAISSAFNHEFMVGAASVDVPGYGPADSKDVAAALIAVRDELEERSDEGFSDTSLVGVSLGAVHALFVAADAHSNERLALRRIIAVNPPVELMPSIQRIDRFYDAPTREWSDAERSERTEDALLKLAVVMRSGDRSRGWQSTPPYPLPFDRTESEYLIGVSFRHVLSATILETQRRHDAGVLAHDATAFVKADLYDEIAHITFEDYVRRFVVPNVGERSGLRSEEVLPSAGLEAMVANLQADLRIRVLTNDDDFLLDAADLARLKSVFGDRLVRIPTGGHLGILTHKEGLDALVRALRQ